MSSPDAAFEKLVGRQLTDGERQRLYRVRDTLGIRSTDALWTLLLALEYYLALYERIPQKHRGRRRVRLVAASEGDREAQAKAAAAEMKRALDCWRARDRERDRRSALRPSKTSSNGWP